MSEDELRDMVLDLLDENARLRSCLSDDAENAKLLMGENARLRELVRNLLVCDKHPVCDDCPYRHEPCDFEYDARELGVEVDE